VLVSLFVDRVCDSVTQISTFFIYSPFVSFKLIGFVLLDDFDEDEDGNNK